MFDHLQRERLEEFTDVECTREELRPRRISRERIYREEFLLPTADAHPRHGSAYAAVRGDELSQFAAELLHVEGAPAAAGHPGSTAAAAHGDQLSHSAAELLHAEGAPASEEHLRLTRARQEDLMAVRWATDDPAPHMEVLQSLHDAARPHNRRHLSRDRVDREMELNLVELAAPPSPAPPADERMQRRLSRDRMEDATALQYAPEGHAVASIEPNVEPLRMKMGRRISRERIDREDLFPAAGPKQG
jgi:hypothetical protein